uniref:Transcription factor IIIC 90kDa subunit N-terminal domain-containing protein n=1 Tax=Anopheles dirus TaxID=7168 RepID=A0A182NKS0_9DIPT
MEMQELTTFQQPEEIIQPFSIHCVGEVVIACSKDHTLVLRLKYRHIVEDNTVCYELSRIKCSTGRPTGALFANEVTLYNASSMEQRKQIMLDQTLFPNIAKVYLCNVKSWLSPSGVFEDNPRDLLIANLNNMGQLTIYRLEEQFKTSWNPYVDVSDTWQGHIYDNHPIESAEELQIMADEVTITCFSWESVIYQRPVRFVFGTKSGKIVLCHLGANGTKIVHVHQEEEAPRVIRYVSIPGQHHFILVGLESGRLAVYRFGTAGVLPQGAFVAQYIATYLDQDIAISAIECEVANDQLLILVVKATFLLAIEINFQGTLLGSVTLDTQDFMITGLQPIRPRNYIITTLPGTISHITVETTRSSATGLQIRQQKVQSDLNVSSYALYGVAASRTRSCWFFLGYPSRRFDHLALRSPTCIFFCRFNQQDALKTLLLNKTLKLVDFHDAAEVVRFHGNKAADSLKPLETVMLVLTLDEESIYQLKLQLIQLSAKISYYTKRTKTLSETLHVQHQFVCSLIEVIHACRVVCWLIDKYTYRTVLNTLQQGALRCLRNFIRTITVQTFPGDYEYLEADLKPKLTAVLASADRIDTPDIMHEVCSFCDAPIDQSSLACPDGHQVFRCVLTKISITLESEEVTCEMCQRYTIGPVMLGTIFEQDTTVFDYRQCCICDAPFRGISNG